MTRDEVIEMAEQCGIDPHDMCEDPRIAINYLEAFAKLVAAKERDECAKEADKRLHDFTMLTSNPPQSGAAFSISQAIRARSNSRGKA